MRPATCLRGSITARASSKAPTSFLSKSMKCWQTFTVDDAASAPTIAVTSQPRAPVGMRKRSARLMSSGTGKRSEKSHTSPSMLPVEKYMTVHTTGMTSSARAAGLVRSRSPCARPMATRATTASAMACHSSLESRKTSMDHWGKRAIASRNGGWRKASDSAPADSLPCDEPAIHHATAPSDGTTGAPAASHFEGRVHGKSAAKATPKIAYGTTCA